MTLKPNKSRQQQQPPRRPPRNSTVSAEAAATLANSTSPFAKAPTRKSLFLAGRAKNQSSTGGSSPSTTSSSTTINVFASKAAVPQLLALKDGSVVTPAELKTVVNGCIR